MRENEVLLQVVSHIASDAKHYFAEASCHESVLKIRKSPGWFNSRWFNRHWYGPDWFTTPEYYVELDKEARETFGDSITIKELSSRVIDYWGNALSDETQ